jgi:hypothetical protein
MKWNTHFKNLMNTQAKQVHDFWIEFLKWPINFGPDREIMFALHSKRPIGKLGNERALALRKITRAQELW